MSAEQYTQHRAELLAGAKTLAEKARDENRDLTVGESDQITASLAEVKSIDPQRAQPYCPVWQRRSPVRTGSWRVVRG